MKIIVANYKYYMQGGAERYLFKFMELARSKGVEVIPFSVHYPKNEPTEYEKWFVGGTNAGANYDPNNHSVGYLLEGAYHDFHNKAAYKSMKALIKQEKPDLLYVLIPGQLTADIIRAAKEEGVPVIHRISDFRLICGNYNMLKGEDPCRDCMSGSYLPMIKNRCVKGSLALSTLRAISCDYNRRFHKYDPVDAVITPPEHTKRILVEAGYFPENKVYVNPTFVDVSRMEPNFTPGDYVLCMGRFAKEKGFAYVVEAMQYLKDLPVKMAITGTEEGCDPALKARIDQLGIREKILFTGFLKGQALEDLTKGALCVACPAIWYENLPNVVLESYAYGKPVIASNLGSLAEIVEDGKTGLLFTPKDPKDIARCIRTLAEDPGYCETLGRTARQVCEEKYNPQAHWQRFLTIAEKVGVRTEGAQP